MDLFSLLSLAVYAIILLVSVLVAVTLQSFGYRGKFPRALLISAVAGMIVPLATYFFYPYFVSMPVAHPLPADDKNALFLHSFQSDFCQVMEDAAQVAGYEIVRIIVTFGYGVLAMVVFFLLSFFIPYSRQPRAIAS